MGFAQVIFNASYIKNLNLSIFIGTLFGSTRIRGDLGPIKFKITMGFAQNSSNSTVEKNRDSYITYLERETIWKE